MHTNTCTASDETERKRGDKKQETYLYEEKLLTKPKLPSGPSSK